jgi:hypothetical protein
MSDSYSPLDLRWFALYARVRHERAVERQLAEKGREAFLPCHALFPGYLFCRFTGRQQGAVLSAFGVVRIALQPAVRAQGLVVGVPA